MSGRAIALTQPDTAHCGFYGKLPARGDFVRCGLAGSFISAWDAWAQIVLTGSRKIMGDAWVPAWLEAPVWRFALPGGLCGSTTVAGLFMPSVDRVGRFFPLCFGCLEAGATAGAAAEKAGGWLAGAEEAGRAALSEDLAPEEVIARIAAPRDVVAISEELRLLAAEVDCGLWWTDGSPRVPPGAFALAVLPDPERFVDMLDARFLSADSGGGA
ncbi:MAG: type VI secretion system-associated protein TagF [Acetobacteraceae bacterium]